MRKLNSKLVMDFISEQGNDRIEKTYVAYTPLDNYLCVAVAESYDNDLEENSARLAVEAVLTAFEQKPSLKRIRRYMQYANEHILLHSTGNQLKVSLTVFVTDYTRMRFGVCGNARLYVLYENLFMRESKTQSGYQPNEDKTDLSAIHNLTGYLGKNKRIKPIISKNIALIEGSTILFATSNLWGRLSKVEILDAFENSKTNVEFLDNLQELLLSLQNRDTQKIGSFTIAGLYIEKTYKEDNTKKKKRKRLLLIILCAALLIAVICWLVILGMRAADRKQMEKINKKDEKATRYIGYENYEKALKEYEEASGMADKLNLNNWQYIEKKEELSERIREREALMNLLQEAESTYAAKKYEQAKKLYAQARKDAVYQGFQQLSDSIEKILSEIDIRIRISQFITLGDMYASTEDDVEALKQYGQALELLSQVMDVETMGDVRAKIYSIRQKQKEEEQARQALAEEQAKAEQEAEEKAKAEQAEAKAKKEEAKAEKEEAEEKAKAEQKEAEEQAKAEQEEAAKAEQEAQEQAKQEAVDRSLVRINTLLVSANKALGEGRIARAKELYEEVLAKYYSFAGSRQDADQVYADVAALGQAITEAEIKEKEDAQEAQLTKASKYAIQAKEAARSNDAKEAKKLYRKALKIYQQLNVWDERTEEIYDELDALKQSGTANPPVLD